MALTKKIFLFLVPLLLVLLFAYTGASKLLGHAKFLAQLEKAGFESTALMVSYAVPVAELLIAILLCTARFRLTGIYLAATAMFFFTGYVLFILSRGPLPCSCGGVLAAMNWKQHLYFNIIFLVLSVASLAQHKSYYAYKGVSRKPLTE